MPSKNSILAAISLILTLSEIQVAAVTLKNRSNLPKITYGTLLRRQNDVPDDPPWGYQSEIPPLPHCTKGLNISVDQCSAEQCTASLLGGCVTTGMLVDRSCLCDKIMTEPIRKACQEDSTILEKTQYYSWLNATCWFISGFQFPKDFQPGENLSYVPVEYLNSAPTCLMTNGSLSESCSSVSSFQQDCGFDESEFWDIFGYYPNLNIWGSDRFVDTRCMCNNLSFVDSCGKFCTKGLDTSAALLWLNSTCTTGSQPQWPGLPNNWADEVVIKRADDLPSNFSRPGCLKSGSHQKDCYHPLNETLNKCSSQRCVVNDTGICLPGTYIDGECFCSTLNFETTCNRSCKLIPERKEYLHWLNKTCSNLTDWDGLPGNWTLLLRPQFEDLFPWHWHVRAQLNVTLRLPNNNRVPLRHCPSNSAKLGAFAAVNAAMAFATPLLGRRTLIHKVTFGMLGRPNSPLWVLTAFIVVGLQVGSNYLNYRIIRDTEGFSGSGSPSLVLLWCSRPRLAWLAVLLIPFQASQAMYFSVAASSLLAELILQLLGSYYMGLTANLAHRQGFYKFRAISHLHHEKYALLMYAGALLWLIIVIFAIVAIVNSALGIGDAIAETGSHVGQRIRDAIQRRIDGNTERFRQRRPQSFDEALKERKHKRERDLTRIPRIVITGMLGCWVAQWLFWVGYVNLEDERYCPPKLLTFAAIWITFSVFGATIGASL